MAEEYHFSDDDEGDALLDRAYDRWEQLGGAAARGPLFQFTMQPIGRRRRWRDVVERAQFNAQLRQLRDPVPGDNIGMALTEALHQAIETELGREQRPAHHFVNFAITAHGFTHAYQTANFTVGEFLQRTARLDEMLATLAGKLNSNEAFNPDCGFQVDVVFVSMPGRGSGRHKQLNVGRLCLDRDNKKKKCIIPIRNRDALCCARAIVTMRAHCHKDQSVDGFRDWDNLKRGLPVQQRQAQALHQQAGVAEGPCGLPELRQFQQALGPQYQLLVMTRMKPFFLIFKGPDVPHQIRLLKSNDHLDGCTSFPAFVNRSYYCLDCERGFNTNDRTHHSCQGRCCRACGRFDCQDYVRGTPPPPRSIVVCVTASFTVGIANVIMKSLSNVNPSKPVSNVRPSTRSSLTNVTSVGMPSVPSVRNGCLSRTTSVTFNPWWSRRMRSQNQPRRGEVAWWRHPLPCLFTRILKPCRMRKVCLWPICYAIRPVKKPPFMCWMGRTVLYNFCAIWMISRTSRTQRVSGRFSWCFTI